MRIQLRLICVFLACTCLPATLRAQDRTIVGTVVDNITLRPIEAAQITIAGTHVGTLSDATGRFVLRLPNGAAAELALNVERIGYRNLTQTVRVGQRDLRLAAEARA